MPFDIAEVITDPNAQLQLATKALFDIRTQARTAFKVNFEAIQDRANLGDFGPNVTGAGRTGLVGFGAAYQAELRRQLDPVFGNILRLAGHPGGDIRANWGRIYRFFVDNGLTFKPRGMAYPTIPSGTSGKGPAGAIVGDATFHRLIVDRYGNPFDSGRGPVDWTARCITDQTNGARQFSEVFRFESDTSLTIFHQGPAGEIQTVTIPNNGGGILAQPSFKIGNAANANLTANGLGRWKDDAGIAGNYELSEIAYRRGTSELAENLKALSVMFKRTGAASILYQEITQSLSRTVPYLFGGSFYRQNASDRTVKVRLGTYEGINFNMTAQPDATWTKQVAVIDENLFLDNFQPTDGSSKLRFEIEVSDGAGEVLADNMFLIPGIPLNGTWIWLVPGQLNHVLNDEMVFTDPAPADNGKHATVVHEAYGTHLPTLAVGYTVPDPA